MAVSKILKADKSGGVEVPVDNHIGLLVGVIHLGVQRNTYKGVESLVDQVLFQFELQDVVNDKGLPVIFGKIERNSMKPKANLLKLGKALGANVDEGLDFDKLVGKPVLLDIQPNEAKTRNVIKNYNPLPGALKAAVKPLMNTPRLFLDVEEITEAQKQELPEWVRKIIDARVRTGGSSSVSGEEVEL